MSALDFIGVAIGVVFVYLLLSLICTAAYEIVEGWLKRRASDLVKGIEDLLEGNSSTNASWWRRLGKWTMQAPRALGGLIQKINMSVSRDQSIADRDQEIRTKNQIIFDKNQIISTKDKEILTKDQEISDIDTSISNLITNITAVLSQKTVTSSVSQVGQIRDLVSNFQTKAQKYHTAARSGISIKKLYEHPLISSLYNGDYGQKSRWIRGSNLPSYIPARNFALAVMSLVYDENALDPEAPLSFDSLREAVSRLPTDLHIRGALLALIDSADQDLDKVRQNIEEWYNGTMDRVAGWYKRRAQWVLGIMGFGFALFLNLDTFAIATTLARDAYAREALVAASQTYIDEAKASPVASPPPTTSCNNDKNSPECRFDTNMTTLRSLPLPIGWSWDKLPPDPLSQNWWWFWFFKILGLLCTGLAVSLGAPFWFDLLNKLMVIRSTVKPKEKSPEEGSEDRPAGARR
ncbi:MAG TPA: hypothetical protein VGD58_25895 [Herpetosiphonaceae bacterium]